MDLTAVAEPGGRGVVRRVSIARDGGGTSLDPALIGELERELDAAEADPRCRVLLLTSAPGRFCTGMDLHAAGRTAASPGSAGTHDVAGGFFDLLRRFTLAPLIVIAAVDGEVAGGGVGLVAASDLVYATERATFALPEALWGLLPCCVLPFLARRVGFHKAYAMSLTTQPVDAWVAAGWGLVDEVAKELTTPVRRLAMRAARLDRPTIGDTKRYADGMYPITEAARNRAVVELDRLMSLPAVRERLSAFAAHGRFPWQA